MTEYQNRILCPSCFDESSLEEKCCSHGIWAEKCVRCGAERQPSDTAWHCTGSDPVASPQAGTDKGGM